MMLRVQDFSYDLPPALIANEPAQPRDNCRLLVFNRHTGRWRHHFFYQLPAILRELNEDLVIVRNNSQVIPARLYGKKPTGGTVEVLLVRQLHSTPHQQVWTCMTKPALKLGQTVIFTAQNASITATCTALDSNYLRQLTFACDQSQFTQFIAQVGQTPIPPYINTSMPESELRSAYQTIYAQHPGSVAAPTAGLHFTADLTQKLINQGVEFIDITLHVGLGTFLGVKCDQIQDHHMHQEYYQIDAASLERLQSAVNLRKSMLAVGTTSTRVLESIAPSLPTTSPIIADSTEIFIYPPYQFQLTDHLITNFHLPESTLLMLVAAFCSQPNNPTTFTTWSQSQIGQAYQAAIARQYRFFSFGDAMLII